MSHLFGEVVIIQLLLVDILFFTLVLEYLREQDDTVLLTQTVQGQAFLENPLVLLRQILSHLYIEKCPHEQSHCSFLAPRRLMFCLLVVDVANGVL